MGGENMAVGLLAVIVTATRYRPMIFPMLAEVWHNRATGAAKTASQQM